MGVIRLERFRTLIGVVVLGLAFAHSATGEPLSQSYLHIGGSPLLTMNRAVRQPIRGTASFEGYNFNLAGSWGFHENWSVWARWDRNWIEDTDLLGLSGIGIASNLEVDENNVMVGPFFNYPVHPRVQVLIGLGFQWAQSESVLRVASDPPVRRKNTDYGIFATAGARAMLWRGLEFSTMMTGSNIAVLDNRLFFEFDLRYHFFDDAFDFGLGAIVGTDDLQALMLSTRIYYMELWRKARGK